MIPATEKEKLSLVQAITPLQRQIDLLQEVCCHPIITYHMIAVGVDRNFNVGKHGTDNSFPIFSKSASFLLPHSAPLQIYLRPENTDTEAINLIQYLLKKFNGGMSAQEIIEWLELVSGFSGDTTGKHNLSI